MTTKNNVSDKIAVYLHRVGLLVCLGLYVLTSAQAQKQICITVDDLPTVSRIYQTTSGQDSLTKRLLTQLTQHKVPAIGFVIGQKISNKGKLDQTQAGLLAQWVSAGMELGNHTYAHKGYNSISAAEYEQDVREGDLRLRPLLQRYGQPLRYFRHPYLQRGNTVTKRDSLVRYLADYAYKEAPVSIDNADYLFSAAYEVALLRKDTTLAASIGQHYVDYMLACVHYYESQADSLFKRPIAHILLTHANTINSVYLGKILSSLEVDGYRFISLEQALRDSAYHSQDTYVSSGGISWIHRWAITQGKRGNFFRGEPEVPPAIVSLAEGK